MKFGVEPLNSIAEKIMNGALRYGDTIVIGDNSSGKSLLLRLLIERAGETDAVYFIDAVNRGFDVSKVIKDDREPGYKTTIVKTRIQEGYFNIKDSFNCYGTLTERIEQIYYSFEQELQELFGQLTKSKFRIARDNAFGEVEFESGRGLLSNGYQAIVRILLELLYYQEKCIAQRKLERSRVIIDELDEFLSPAFAYRIFSFIKERFPQMEFIVATHSCDLVAGAKNANLVILDDSGYEVVDANDYSSVSEVQIIFDRVFGAYYEKTKGIEEVLRRLLNNKINKAWTEQDQQCLERLQEESLTASQQLICRQIVEW